VTGRRSAQDEGSIVIAMLGIMIVTFIVLVGMTQIIVGQRLTQHDRNYEQALSAAETGLDKLLSTVKAAPLAASAAPVTGGDPTTSTTYSATATGGSGHWVLTSTGTATRGPRPVSRTISQHVDVHNLLTSQAALFGTRSLTLGGAGSANGVDTYDSAVSSAVCAADGSAQSMGYASARMCTHASPALGSLGTDGPLTMPGAALPNVAGADIFNAGVSGYPNPDNTGTCAGDAATCAAVGTSVTTHPDPLEFPLSSQCANGIGAGVSAYDGSLALAANAVYNFTDVTLNVTAIANLQNLAASQIVICFSGELDILPILPINTTIATLLPLRLVPRPPSTLILISTAPASGTPKIKLNAGLPLASSLSAVIYAPNADCTATAHVDLYGLAVCGTVSAPNGINVHYDNQVGNLAFDSPLSVSDWREQ
jgi:hypothetical protein